MDATVLSLRWQNIAAIIVIILGLGVVSTLLGQAVARFAPS